MGMQEGIQHRHAAKTCSMHMQHGYAAGTCSMYMLHGQAARTNRIEKLQGHAGEHAAWTCGTTSIIDKQ
jgi:hypothetical protein